MIKKRNELAASIGCDGKIYALGGFGGDQDSNSCQTSCERLDLVKQTWEMIKPMKYQRRALASIALPDGIYAIGGYDGQNYLPNVERFDSTTMK